MKTVGLFHYDLDGVGSDILMSKLFKFDKKFQCGYGKIKEYISSGKVSNYDNLVIADVSLTKDQFMKLKGEYRDNFLYIDHHQQSVDMIDSLKKKYKITKTKMDSSFCATALIFRTFYKQLSKFKGIGKFVSLVDSYDMWRVNTHPDMFLKGYDLNVLFWKYGYYDFFERFSKNLSTQMTKDEQSWIDNHKSKRDNAIKSTEKIPFGKNSLFVFNPPNSYINDFPLQLPNYDFYYMLFSNTDGKLTLSLRSKKDAVIAMGDIARDAKEEYSRFIGTAGGHPQAAGIDFDDDVPYDTIIDVLEFINDKAEMEPIEVVEDWEVPF
jgi:oligoribonuclease NrnB/cAMP/cGMP phosphodiesterase (DHH superfamily)